MNLTARIAATLNRFGAARDNVVGAAAMPAVSRGSKGSGAPSSRRAPLALFAALAVIVSLAFTAAPALAYSPTVEIDPPTGSYYTTAHITGTFDPGTDGGGAECWFEDSADGGTTWSGRLNFDCSDLSGTGPREVQIDLSGLSYSTEYRVRLVSTYNAIEGFSAEPTFTTNPEPTNPPVLAIGAPGTLEYTRAHVSGTVDPEGGNANPGGEAVPIKWHFQYSTDPVNLGWSDGPGGEISGPEAEGSAPIPVSVELAGLTHHSAYVYRLVATYGDVPAASSEPDGSFETLEASAPSASIDPITTFTDTSAHFSGHVSPNAPGPAPQDPGFDTSWSFHCTPECPGLSATTIPADNASHVVEADATGLEPDTAYEVTLEASNAAGPAADTKPLATATILPTIKPAPGASDREGGYTLQGVVNPHNSTVACQFVYGPNSATDPGDYAFAVPCSPVPGEVNRPVTVEGHVTGLTPGATYHSRLVVSNGAGTEKTDDQIFVPTLDPTIDCPNEMLRKENSSLALPECRAYEQVSPPSKGGYPAKLFGYEEGSSVGYTSAAGNIANSGQGSALPPTNWYVANRSGTGWQTIPNLNGPSGSLFSGSEPVGGGEKVPKHFSGDLQSSLWYITRGAQSGGQQRAYLRGPDGNFTLLGTSGDFLAVQGDPVFGASADLSRVVFNGTVDANHVVYGPGVYEYVGTGNGQPTRVDIDNSATPISTCDLFAWPSNAMGRDVSTDGATIIFEAAGGCGGANPPASELWARVGDTTSYEVSASLCSRTAADPHGACNAPADAVFEGAAADGSRVYFSTTQQLIDTDVDQTSDLYACDLPTLPQAPTGPANPCSSLSEVSAGPSDPEIENVVRISDDGSRLYLLARGVLAGNLGVGNSAAIAGQDNLYVWRKDATHPSGQMTFITALQSNDLSGAQTTPDGGDLAFATASQLVPTDTDNARDVYRYDNDLGQLVRVTTNIFGVGGNGDNLDAGIESGLGTELPAHHRRLSLSDDGESIVFTTNEALSPLDGNGARDVYLWKAGHVSLISTGSVGGGTSIEYGAPTPVVIDGSGQNIYFETDQSLTPSDGDDVGDVYDARVGGGFSFAQPKECLGSACQAHSPPPLNPSSPNSPAEGNVKPRRCPKGKILRKRHCVAKAHHRHHKKSHERADHDRGGSK